MRDIVELNDEEYDSFMKLPSELPILGEGAEGTCVLGVDGYAYKIYDGITDYEYDIDNIVMSSDYNLKSFAFPNRLYVHDGELCAYRMKLIYPNLFDVENSDLIKKRDLLKAIDRYVKDLEIISRDGILTYELPYNLMFDGKYLVGVDTPSYKKTDHDTFKENLEILEYALDSEYYFLKEKGSKLEYPLDDNKLQYIKK